MNMTRTISTVSDLHDLTTVLCDLPPACRVVVVDREGRVIACEVLAMRVGDALALMVCEVERDIIPIAGQ